MQKLLELIDFCDEHPLTAASLTEGALRVLVPSVSRESLPHRRRGHGSHGGCPMEAIWGVL